MHGLRSKYKRESEGLCIRAEDPLPGGPSPFAYPEDGRAIVAKSGLLAKQSYRSKGTHGILMSPLPRLFLARREAVWRVPIR